ncbi:hypothetical protein [Nocardiopsis sp. ATB16-24]|uniref:hypothetical protein n=1 Tax=Nocardiopsis sp. ATB16-24 TaxID=3019555 RepID=UPI002553DF2A|nr:hypothetical protein [Nocardiopsis sp. ATB16-24]
MRPHPQQEGIDIVGFDQTGGRRDPEGLGGLAEVGEQAAAESLDPHGLGMFA